MTVSELTDYIYKELKAGRKVYTIESEALYICFVWEAIDDNYFVVRAIDDLDEYTYERSDELRIEEIFANISNGERLATKDEAKLCSIQ